MSPAITVAPDAATRSSSGLGSATVETSQPSERSFRTHAAPIPDEPPVISATRHGLMSIDTHATFYTHSLMLFEPQRLHAVLSRIVLPGSSLEKHCPEAPHLQSVHKAMSF